MSSPPKKNDPSVFRYHNLPNRREISPPPPPGTVRYRCVPGTGRMKAQRSRYIAVMRRIRGCQGGAKLAVCESDEEEEKTGDGVIEGSGPLVSAVDGGAVVEEMKGDRVPVAEKNDSVEILDPPSPEPTVVIDLDKEDGGTPGSESSPILIDEGEGSSRSPAGTLAVNKRIRGGPSTPEYAFDFDDKLVGICYI